jgi:uncharacterized cupin superfamily protein
MRDQMIKGRKSMSLDFAVALDLSSMDIGGFLPKPSSTTGQLEASAVLWKSADGRFEIGVWECTEGHFTAFREVASEKCHVISGRVTVKDDKQASNLGPGDFLLMPLGWRGEWTVHERVRKLYILDRSN